MGSHSSGGGDSLVTALDGTSAVNSTPDPAAPIKGTALPPPAPQSSPTAQQEKKRAAVTAAGIGAAGTVLTTARGLVDRVSATNNKTLLGS